MQKALTAVCALLLTGCEGDSPAVDGYKFGQPEYALSTVTVTFVQYDSEADFLRAADSNGAGVEGVQAFSVLSPARAACEVHIRAVADDYRPEWLGHEIAHCMHGRWHR